MTNAEIEALERDVEQARGRLVADLAVLRSAGNLSDLKRDVSEEVSRTKDELVGRAKNAARQRAEGVLDGIKARVAANPGAALAIGAGLAWRLYRHPPIASLLVGAGLVGLFRTDPQHPAIGADMAARAVDYAGIGAAKAERMAAKRHGRPDRRNRRDRTGSGERDGRPARPDRGDREGTGRRARGDGDGTGRRTRLGRNAAGRRPRRTARRRRPANWPTPPEGGSARGVRTAATRTESRPPIRSTRLVAGAGTGETSASVRSAARDGRDTYLLGAAGLAIAAAIGIAYQRRSTEETARLDR